MSPFTINGCNDAFLFLTDDNQLSLTENDSTGETKKLNAESKGRKERCMRSGNGHMGRARPVRMSLWAKMNQRREANAASIPSLAISFSTDGLLILLYHE